MDEAAHSGHMDIVLWLHENQAEGCTKWVMNLAARNDHLDIVKWLHEHRKEGCSPMAMDFAAAALEWLDTHQTKGCTRMAMKSAATNRHLKVLCWLFNRRHEISSFDAVGWAVSLGRLDIADWLQTHEFLPIP